MSILDELKSDHDKVRELLVKADEIINKYPDVDEAQEEKLIQKILSELEPHSKAEEEIFYKALRKKDEDSLQPYEGVEEHHLALQLLKSSQKDSLETSRKTAKIQVLKEVVLHHIKEEESQYFRAAKNLFSVEELNDLGKRFVEKKKEIMRSKS